MIAGLSGKTLLLLAAAAAAAFLVLRKPALASASDAGFAPPTGADASGGRGGASATGTSADQAALLAALGSQNDALTNALLSDSTPAFFSAPAPADTSSQTVPVSAAPVSDQQAVTSLGLAPYQPGDIISPAAPAATTSAGITPASTSYEVTSVGSLGGPYDVPFVETTPIHTPATTDETNLQNAVTYAATSHQPVAV